MNRLRSLSSLTFCAVIAIACGGGGGGGGGGGAPQSSPPPTPPSSPPQLTALNPNQGQVGQVITIQGMNFDVSPSGNDARFGSTQATVFSATSAELTVEVPSGLLAGSMNVTVTTAAGQSNSLQFTVSAANPGSPSINSIQPNVSQVGQTITIQGSQFDPSPANNQVTLNGVTATVQSASANQLQVVVPNGASSGPTVVTVGGNSSNAVQLLVTSPQLVNQGNSGSQALDFLRDTTFTHLLVEIDFIQGKDANNSALNLLITRLNERCRKSNITLLIDDTIPSQNINTWRVSDLQSVEGQFRDHYSNANTTVLYFLYVNGGSEFDNGNSRVLGISYNGSALGMFRDNMDSSATPLLSTAAVEQAVIVHEAGHALGLVNNGIAMVNPHQDSANGAHDVDNNCVMHFSIESDAISQILGAVPNQFDSQCIADMQAAGGK